jgi:hypothetical protein
VVPETKDGNQILFALASAGGLHRRRVPVIRIADYDGDTVEVTLAAHVECGIPCSVAAGTTAALSAAAAGSAPAAPGVGAMMASSQATNNRAMQETG